jgi:hypothetical protein
MGTHTITFTTGTTAAVFSIQPLAGSDFNILCSCGKLLNDNELCVERAPPLTTISFALSAASPGVTITPALPQTVTVKATAPSEGVKDIFMTRTTTAGAKTRKLTLKVNTESVPATDGGHGAVDPPLEPEPEASLLRNTSGPGKGKTKPKGRSR